jgi:formylglycine-generating enzyme required for sulfatase activity/tRNA A-37 threonylcarbamoyl transferase component Bud32
VTSPGQQPTFGRYKLLSLLGKGGTARVYRALRPGPMGFGKEVALKIIERSSALDEEATTSLVNEARLGCQLRHKNIVSIDEFDTVDDTFYIAMEYVEGWPLDVLLAAQRRAGGHLPLPTMLEILIELCEGLGYAHALADKEGEPLGIVHRDLKPGNVLVSIRGEVKIADFGTAKAKTNVKQTQDGFTRGTPAYMSPEQVTGRALDPRSDIFSFGALLHEVVTLEMAFPGENLVTVMHQVLEGDHREIPQRVGKVAPALEPVVRRCMNSDPVGRYQSAATLAADLRKIRIRAGARPSVAEWVQELVVDLPVTTTGEFGWTGALEEAIRRHQESEPPPTQPAQPAQPARPARPPKPPVELSSGLDGLEPVLGASAEPDRLPTAAIEAWEATLFPSEAEDLPPAPAPEAPPAAAPPRRHDPSAETAAVPAQKPGRPQRPPPRTASASLGIDSSLLDSSESRAPGRRPPPGTEALGARRSTAAPPRSRSDRPEPRAAQGPAQLRQGRNKRRGTSLKFVGSLAWKLVALYIAVLLFGPAIGGPTGETIVELRDWQVSLVTGDARPAPWATSGPAVRVAASDLVALPAGKLRLGAPRGQEGPPRMRRAIEIPLVLVMSHEVSIDEYRAGCHREWWQLSCPGWAGPERGQQGSHPAVRITWQQASDWCETQGWRLPTEAEWEWAARGKASRSYPWGDEFQERSANYCDRGCPGKVLSVTGEDDGYPRTAPVGQFPAGATPEGIHDLAGNVSEWTLDCWTRDHAERSSWHASTAGECRQRVTRGASWRDAAEQLVAWRRSAADPELPTERVGFRCVQGEDPKAPKPDAAK